MIWLGFINCACVVGPPRAKVTLVVTDEQGERIEKANTGVGFERNTGWGTERTPDHGITGKDGTFSASNNTNGVIGYSATKDGYYRAYGNYYFVKNENGKWSPWNPKIQVLLRKIENPVPMYARDTKMSRLKIPETGKDIGFDLVSYDWVTPYGKGVASDFIFRLDKRFTDRNDFDGKLTITFSNAHDGIQLIKENRKNGSCFKLPRYAPENGYENSLTKTMFRTPHAYIHDNSDDNNNYIFRIRSEVKDGKLLRAMYGKIQGDVIFDPRDCNTTYIGFTYYLNPDFTRNLEFDPKENLFLNLPRLEKVCL